MFPQAVFAPIGQVSGPLVSAVNTGMEDVFLFDLETLTTSSFGHLEHSFADYLKEFLDERSCYLLTRNSFNDVCTKLSKNVLRRFAGVFASCGTELWVEDQLADCHDHQFSDELYEFVVNVVRKSAYYDRSPPLIDQGSACLRICLAGIRCSAGGLRMYETWETRNKELPDIIGEFKFRFSDHTIYQDTPTSLLILPNSYSAKIIRDYIGRGRNNARMISYLHTETAKGYGLSLCEAHQGRDVLSKISGPSDVSQLMSYEVRRTSGKERLINVCDKIREDA